MRRASTENYSMASSTPHSKQSTSAQVTVSHATSNSVASTSQNSIQHSQRPTQYEHVTVVTQLAGQAVPASRIDTTSAPVNVSYAVSTTTGGAPGLQIHPPATLTQQVQLSVPTLAGSLSKVGSGRSNSIRSQNFRNNGARSQKTPLSAMLPMMGRGGAKQLVSMSVIGDDGPTVRQHLQQQQQKARLQQQLAMQARQKAEETAKQNAGEGNSQSLSHSQPSSSASGSSTSLVSATITTTCDQQSSSEIKTVTRTTHVQRPYTPRVSTIQRQRVAAEAVRQLQLKNSSASSSLPGSLPPISLGPSRPAKMSRLAGPETHNGGEILTVLQTQPQPNSTYQTVRQIHYRSTPQGAQIVSSNSQQASSQSMEQVYQVVTSELQQFPTQSVVKIEAPQVSNECQQTSVTSATVMGNIPTQTVRIAQRKRPQRTQSQVRVTFLEQSKPTDFVCAAAGTGVDPNCSNSANYSQQNVYGTTRQIVTTREIAQGEQFFPSPSPVSINVMDVESSEHSGVQQQSSIMQHNNLQQKQPQHQVQHSYQQPLNQQSQQQQLQIRSSPQLQTQQVTTQHRIQQSGSHQQLQEVVVNSQQQQQQQVQSLAGQQQTQQHQIPSERQLQTITNQQQHLRISYQGQQRVVQGLTQAGTQQRIRRQSNVQTLEQQRQQQPTSVPISHLQHTLQPQPQVQIQPQQIQIQIQQQQQPHTVHRRAIPQFRQQQQQQLHPVQNSGYSPRFQQPQRVQQTLQPNQTTTNTAESLDGSAARQQNSVVVTHHTQVRSLPPGVINRQVAHVPLQQRIYSLPQHVAQQQREEEIYKRKLYFLKTSIKALTYKNAALCDEIARLNQRIQTVSDQRRMLAKRLQHHERNRIRRIQTKLKKNKAALEAKLKSFQETPLSLGVDEEMRSLHEEDSNDFNDVDSERTGSPLNLSPSSTISTSCLGTPDSQPSGSIMHVNDGSNVRSTKSKAKISRHRRLGSSVLSTRSVGKRVKKGASN